jgi:hypothetical protein
MHLPARFAAIVLTFAPVFLQRIWRCTGPLPSGAMLAPASASISGAPSRGDEMTIGGRRRYERNDSSSC